MKSRRLHCHQAVVIRDHSTTIAPSDADTEREDGAATLRILNPLQGGYSRQGSDVAVDTSDFAPAPQRGSLPDPGEDDIPF